MCVVVGTVVFWPHGAHADGDERHAARSAPLRRPAAVAWPRVYITDVYARHAVYRALTHAAAWLASPGCQGLLLEFRDSHGRPLTEKLAETGGDLEHYLRLLVFLDGSDGAPCRQGPVLAFTSPGSRVVYVCGREFERACKREPEQAPSIIIHEMLHSLGLPEHPPPPRYITRRVQEACWP
jgi:hypothetical protein